MPKTKQITVYQFIELDDRAKSRARRWFIGAGLDNDWHESIYEDAKNTGLQITSFDLDRNRHAKGKFITNAPECAEKIIAEHGEECDTYRTAKAYLSNLATVYAKAGDDDSLAEDLQEELNNEFLKSVLEDYSIMLQKESEYICSDEYVDEGITMNEYEFYIDGVRARV